MKSFFRVILPSLRVVSSEVISAADIQPKILIIPFRQITLRNPLSSVTEDILAEAPYIHADATTVTLTLFFPYERRETDEALKVFVYEPKTFEQLSVLSENANPFLLSRLLSRDVKYFHENMATIMYAAKSFRMALPQITCPLPIPFNTFAALNVLGSKMRPLSYDDKTYLQFNVENPDTEAAVYALTSPYDCTYNHSRVVTKLSAVLPSAYAEPFTKDAHYGETLLRLLSEDVEEQQIVEEVIDYALKPF